MEEQIEAVQRMQDYIQTHSNESITQADLVRVSLYSSWYPYRLSVRHAGMTPSDYTRRFKLPRPTMQLRDGGARVTDTAFEMGFGSVDGYQRALFRELGYNPDKYAVNPVPISLFTPYGVKYRHIGKEKNMEQAENVFIQVMEKPERKALIKGGSKQEDTSPIVRKWGTIYGDCLSVSDPCAGSRYVYDYPDVSQSREPHPISRKLRSPRTMRARSQRDLM